MNVPTVSVCATSNTLPLPHVFYQLQEVWEGKHATTLYKRLADLLSNKRNHPNHGLVKMSTFKVLLELHGTVHAYLSFLFKPFSHDGINDLESMNQHCNTCMKMECMR